MYSAPPCHSPSHVAVPDRDCRGGFLAACCLRRLPEARARATHRARRSPIRSSALLHAPIGTRTKALSAAADGSGIDFGMYARCPDAGLLRLLARERECRPADELMTPACTASTSAPSVNQAALMTHLQCSATRAAAVARRRLAQRAWEPHLRHRRSERVRARQMRDNATANPPTMGAIFLSRSRTDHQPRTPFRGASGRAISITRRAPSSRYWTCSSIPRTRRTTSLETQFPHRTLRQRFRTNDSQKNEWHRRIIKD